MAAITPIKVPVLADTDKLVEACHTLLGSACEHVVGAVYTTKSCEMVAQMLIEAGGFVTLSDFLSSEMATNDDVREVIIDAMQESWDEGHRTACVIPHSTCPAHKNPYVNREK